MKLGCASTLSYELKRSCEFKLKLSYANRCRRQTLRFHPPPSAPSWAPRPSRQTRRDAGESATGRGPCRPVAIQAPASAGRPETCKNQQAGRKRPKNGRSRPAGRSAPAGRLGRAAFSARHSAPSVGQPAWIGLNALTTGLPACQAAVNPAESKSDTNCVWCPNLFIVLRESA